MKKSNNGIRNFFFDHPIFWLITIIVPLLILLITRFLNSQAGGEILFLSFPLFIISVFVYRDSIKESVIANILILLYFGILLIIKKFTIGDSSYGFIFLIGIIIPVLVISLIGVFLIRKDLDIKGIILRALILVGILISLLILSLGFITPFFDA